MSVVPLAVVALVLLIAGLAKVRDPKPTAGALRAMGLPGDPRLVRALGAGEAVLGGAAIAVDHRGITWLLAVAYAAFTAFVALALRRGTKLQSCGCFGGLEVPPTRLHVAVDALATVAAVVAAVRGTEPLLQSLEGEAGGGVPLLAAVLTAAALGIAVLTVLPMTLAEARR